MKRKKVAICIGSTLFFMLMLFVFISYSNPQRHKYIFMWQAYYYPADGSLVSEFGTWDPPTDYTGTWRIWYDNGVLGVIAEVKDGVVDFEGIQMYDRDGNEMPAYK